MTDFEKEMARELEVSTDMNMVACLLTSQGWHDKAQADDLGSALVGYESKYGRAVLRDLEDMINEAIYQTCNRIHEGVEDA
jgi:hypothetical protein